VLKTTSYLDQLFPKLRATAFLADYWPRRLYVEHGPLRRIEWAAGLYDLSSCEAVFDWAHTTRGKRFQADLPVYRDEVQHLKELRPTEAEALYRAGMTLRFGVDSMRPVADYIAGMKRELGLPAMAHSRNITYLSPKGEATSCHFDANANIIIQLVGSKRWTVAPNLHITAPVDRYTASHGRPSPILADHVARLPRTMPAGARTIVLKPGSVLFVPRGYWHETHAASPSLSLNFTTNEPTWASLVTSAIQHRILRDPAWRELADGLSAADPGRRRAAHERLAERLASLRSVVEDLDPTGVVDHATRFHEERRDQTATVYGRASGAQCELSEGVLTLRRSGRTQRIRLAAGVSRITSVVLARAPGATFSDEDVVAAVSDLDPVAIRRGLRVLLRLGVVELLSEPMVD
jgi:50S ribosomal protein L16 3-hydroxylase